MEVISTFLRILTFLLLSQKMWDLRGAASLATSRDVLQEAVMMKKCVATRPRFEDYLDFTISPSEIAKSISPSGFAGNGNAVCESRISNSHVRDHQPDAPRTVGAMRRRQWKVPWFTTRFTIHSTCFQSRITSFFHMVPPPKGYTHTTQNRFDYYFHTSQKIMKYILTLPPIDTGYDTDSATESDMELMPSSNTDNDFRGGESRSKSKISQSSGNHFRVEDSAHISEPKPYKTKQLKTTFKTALRSNGIEDKTLNKAEPKF